MLERNISVGNELKGRGLRKMKQSPNHAGPASQFEASDKARRTARGFIDALGDQQVELERLASLAKRCKIRKPADYVAFKQLFEDFQDHCQQFQMLSRVTEKALTGLDWSTATERQEKEQLSDFFYRLQVPMLQRVITTNLQLLRVWDCRVQEDGVLPYGAREFLLNIVRVIRDARLELLRPRFAILVSETVLRDADRASRLLRQLVKRAPALFSFIPEEELATDLFEAPESDLLTDDQSALELWRTKQPALPPPLPLLDLVQQAFIDADDKLQAAFDALVADAFDAILMRADGDDDSADSKSAIAPEDMAVPALHMARERIRNCLEILMCILILAAAVG